MQCGHQLSGGSEAGSGLLQHTCEFDGAGQCSFGSRMQVELRPTVRQTLQHSSKPRSVDAACLREPVHPRDVANSATLQDGKCPAAEQAEHKRNGSPGKRLAHQAHRAEAVSFRDWERDPKDLRMQVQMVMAIPVRRREPQGCKGGELPFNLGGERLCVAWRKGGA